MHRLLHTQDGPVFDGFRPSLYLLNGESLAGPYLEGPGNGAHASQSIDGPRCDAQYFCHFGDGQQRGIWILIAHRSSLLEVLGCAQIVVDPGNLMTSDSLTREMFR
jgi:hypothetical protein